jgi:hypothetical protein
MSKTTITVAATITLDEATATLATHPEALLAIRAILGQRIARCEAKGDTHKAQRTQRWLDAHPVKAPKAQAPKAQPKARAKGVGSRGGDPVKFIRGQLAQRLSGAQPGTSPWWIAYNSADVKEGAERVYAKHLASK